MPKLPILTLKDLLATIKKNNPECDCDLITLAYEFGEKAHAGQMRMSGEPYFQHCVWTAHRLAELKLDTATIAAGLLHDVVEDCAVSPATLRKEFGDEICELVAGVTKLGKLKYRGIERYVENLRKMTVAMAEEIRVIFIKFCDRVHNLKTLDAHPEPTKRKRIAQESIEIYAVIANRLGMGELKGELEDLAFPFVNPQGFAKTKALFEAKVKVKKPYIDRFIKLLEPTLKETVKGSYKIHGRLKHLYTLWQKLQKPEVDWNIDRVYDLIAVRVIVPDIADCYGVLGAIHQTYPPMPGRIKDYIATPKANGYQSLHTTVLTPDDQIIEIQIRTFQMHEDAEHGAAAHWTYKETPNEVREKDTFVLKNSQRLDWIQHMLRWQQRAQENPEAFLTKIKTDFFADRIFVLTPRGDVIDLPREATPVDFAYAIHTDLGHSCTGAMVNDSIMPLDSVLSSGDIVKIIVDKKRKKPSSDWLEFVKTNTARDHIRSVLKLHAPVRAVRPRANGQTNSRRQKRS